MPTPYAAGETVDTTAVMNAFITQVRNFAITNATYHAGSRPGPFPATSRLGSGTAAMHTWPAVPVHGQILTTNMFYILHHFAISLTRIRRGRFVYKHGGAWYGNGNAASYSSVDQVSGGFAYTGYNDGYVIGFDIPPVPAPVATPPSVSQFPFDASQLNTFLMNLRAAVTSIQSDTTLASDFTACHTNCHTSCHGSRGRR